MLSMVQVRTRQGNILDLPLEDPSNGLIVEDIEGLDPVKATLVSSSFAQSDGAQYHSSRREIRTIKLTLGLESDYDTNTVEVLRRRLYSFLMPKSEVTLRFFLSDDLHVDIVGRVELLETPLFAKTPTVSISLMCFNPDFFDPEPVDLELLTSAQSDELLDPGTSVEYIGSVETGIILTLLPNRALSAFTVYHRPPDNGLRTLDFVTPLGAGDKLRISTVSGAKSVLLNRAGTETSALYGLSPQSNWIELQPGKNLFKVFANGEPIPYHLEYTTKYGGL